MAQEEGKSLKRNTDLKHPNLKSLKKRVLLSKKLTSATPNLPTIAGSALLLIRIRPPSHQLTSLCEVTEVVVAEAAQLEFPKLIIKSKKITALKTQLRAHRKQSLSSQLILNPNPTLKITHPKM